MDGLADIYRAAFKKSALAELGSLAIPWEEVVGELVARHCRPRRLKNGTLFVSASNAAWAHQLQYFKTQIQDQVNNYLGAKRIRDIRFEGRGFDDSAHPEEEVTQLRELSSDEVRIINDKVMAIGDEILREDLRKLMTLDLIAGKKGKSFVSRQQNESGEDDSF